MLPSFLLSLREGLEAALIIGIVLGALGKIRRTDLSSALWLGVASAIGVSIVAGVALTLIGVKLEGAAEQIFEGITMLLAAGILTWMIFWMSRQSRFIKSELESGVNKAAATTGRQAIFSLAFFAVVREGIELAIFLVASFFITDSGAATTASAVQTIAGALLGLFTSVLLGWSLFATTVRLDLRRFFQVTGTLLILFAAGLVAHGVHEFNEVGWIPAIVEHVWDVNAIINEKSFFGELLKTLFGYNANPSLTEMAAYALYFICIFTGLKLADRQTEKQPAQSQA